MERPLDKFDLISTQYALSMLVGSDLDLAGLWRKFLPSALKLLNCNAGYLWFRANVFDAQRLQRSYSYPSQAFAGLDDFPQLATALRTLQGHASQPVQATSIEEGGAFHHLLPLGRHGFVVFRRTSPMPQLLLHVIVPILQRLADASVACLQHEHSEAMRLHNERARIILDSIGDAVIVTDAEGRVERLNRVAEVATGWTLPEAQGRPLTEIFPIFNEHTGQPVVNPVELVLRDGKTVGLANHTMLRDRAGRYKPIDDSAAPVIDAQGKVCGVVLVFHDISERHAAQQALEHERVQSHLHLQQRLRQTQTIADLSEAVSRAKSLQEIFEMAMDATQKLIGCDRAAVLLFDPDGVMRFKAWRGLSESYRQRFDGHSPWRPEEKNARPILVPDEENWEDGKALVPEFRKEGIRALAFIPLEYEARLLGKFMAYFATVHEFGAEEVQLLQTIARLVGYAIGEMQAAEQLELAAVVYRVCSEGMMIADAQGNIVSVNSAFTAITGYTAQEVIGRHVRLLSSGRHGPDFYRAMWTSLNTSGTWSGEIWNRHKDGRIYPVRLVINTLYHQDGSAHRRVALYTDITDQKRIREEIEYHANYDVLTGLPNRRLFNDRLEQALKESRRSGIPLALLLLDLDNFKEVNDTLGHDAGDELLKEVALRLIRCVRETDTVARLSGDEFVIILPATHQPWIAERVATDIQSRLSESVHIGNEQVFVSASIGIALSGDGADSIVDLLKHADQAMYAAKATGGKGFSHFTPALQLEAQRRMQLAKALRKALQKQELSVHYQPIVALATGCIVKAEALLRWNHPKFGMITPAEFIPIAEGTGLIHDIGDWVFREAAQLAKRLQTSAPSFQISINKSPVQFRSTDDGLDGWLDFLQQLGLRTDAIVVEITEGALLETGRIVVDRLIAMRNAGMQLAIDDFGTGYSALSYLKKYDIDYLKIDRSFVCDLTYDANDQALCEAIIVMAHRLGLKVIAEGVETAQQRDMLLAMNCDYGQGVFFSEPVLADELEQLCLSRT